MAAVARRVRLMRRVRPFRKDFFMGLPFFTGETLSA
jgi:hypothetical protein